MMRSTTPAPVNGRAQSSTIFEVPYLFTWSVSTTTRWPR